VTDSRTRTWLKDGAWATRTDAHFGAKEDIYQ
jgi:hypothetical protein